MAERVWSQAQEQAIATRGEAVLVSAGAGSGKTSVLVERVKRLVLEDAIDIDRILIVTFTEAAAGEMRARIAGALREALAERPSDAYLARQIHLLDRAAISTLHSFCLQVIRSAALELPVDPGFRIADEEEAGMLRFSVLEQLLDDSLQSGEEAFLALSDRYSGSFGDARLGRLILELYDFTRSQPHPEDWLNAAVQRSELDATRTLSTVSFAAELFASFEHALRYAADVTREAMIVCERDAALAAYEKTLQRDAVQIDAAVQCVLQRDYEGLRRSASVPFSRLAQAPDAADWGKERVKELRAKAKQAVIDIADRLAARSEAELLADLSAGAAALRALAQLVTGFAHAYQEAKRLRGCVDFADLEHLSYRVLADEQGGQGPLAVQFAQRFEAILIDEYQDMSPIQDAILSLVAHADHANEFQVGDVKQSIYRFRMAEPNLFLRKYDLYASGQGARRIDLQDNYRSREGIVDAVNFLFGQLFAPVLGGITYDESARMRAQAAYPPLAGELSLAGPVELHLIDRTADDASDPAADEADSRREEGEENPEEEAFLSDRDASEGLSAIELEARVIGRRLLDLHRSRVLVWQPDTREHQPIRWRDMVVLLRSKAGRVEPMLRVFRQLGIPVHGESDSGYYTGLEMRLALALLDTVDNPLQDIALASVLRSPICGFQTSELAMLRGYAKDSMAQAVRRCAAQDRTGLCDGAAALADRARDFNERLQGWRTFARTHSVTESVTHLLTDSGLSDFVTALPDGAVRLANLRALKRQAAAYDELYEGRFSGFVAFLRDHQVREGDAGSARALGENEDVVRLMTIHKSKGLEFPVVCVADLGKQFRLRDAELPVRFHRTLGLGADMVDLQRMERWTTIAVMAIDAVEQKERLSEEARILYVACTRAREKLILVGSMRKLAAAWTGWTDQADQQAGQRCLETSVLLRAKRYLDWIGPAVYRFAADGSPLFTVTLWGRAFDRQAPAAAAASRDPVDWRAVSELQEGAIGSLYTVDQRERQTLADMVADRVWLGSGKTLDAPAKMSVTEWKNNWQDATLEDESLDAGASILPLARVRLERPQFVQRDRALTGAERGTLFHVAMQHVSLARNLAQESVVSAELSTLATRGFLPQQHVGAVSAGEIAAFFQSPLGQRMLSAPDRVRREVSFTMAMPLSKLNAGRSDRFADADGDRVLVQGTADCLIVNEEGVILLDYKTDRVYGDCMESARQYELQVGLYREAIERAYGRQVSAVYLYFSSVRQLVQMAGAQA